MPGSNSTVAALEIADHDCAAGSVQNSRSGRGGNLDDLRAVSLSRVPVHSAAIRYSWSGWRLEVASQRGPGAIVLVEMPRGVCYIGQGLLLGWTQDRLASAYGRLSPRPEAVPDDFLQLD